MNEDWDVTINGHGYMLDKDHPAFGADSAYLGSNGIDTIPLLRQQADNSSEPGEASNNPEDLWSRSQTTWHKGAGQAYLDAPDSDRARFSASIGIDPWTRGQLTPLNTTSLTYTTSATNLQVLRVGEYVYIQQGDSVLFAPAPYTSWTSCLIQDGESTVDPHSMASDGYNVWVALAGNGIHATTRGDGSSSHYSDLQATVVSYVKGRLMAAKDNAIYNVTGSGAAPTALLTHANTDFRWVGFAEGLSVIYAAGFSGDKSLIYKTAVKTDGTALDAPSIAGELPDGEIVRSIQGYLGFLFVGTDQGWRSATQDVNGNLTFGPLVHIPTTGPVRCFEPQGNFVWFGIELNQFNALGGQYNGLGRIDMTTVNDSGAFAYATDLIATTGSDWQVQSVATCGVDNDKRIMAVSGKGFYLETDTPTSATWLSSGKIGYGLSHFKRALRLGITHEKLASGQAVTMKLSPDDMTLYTVGTSNAVGSSGPDEFALSPGGSEKGFLSREFSLHVYLTNGVKFERWELRAYPVKANRGREVLVPILLHELIVTDSGAEKHVDVVAEFSYLESLSNSDEIHEYTELTLPFDAFFDQGNFQRHSVMRNRSFWNGTYLAKLKVLGG